MRIRIQTPLDPEDASKKMDLDDEAKERIMLLVGNLILSTITLKTADGKDADGNEFVRYSKQYESWKRRKGKGRTPMSKGDWMHLTGDMMGKLNIVEHDADHVVIGFEDPDEGEKAYYHCVSGAGTNHVIRNFMGLSDADIEDIEDDVQAQLTGRSGL